MARGDIEAGSLRVAIVSTCALATPPRAYGGTELVIAELARELRELGHHPVVFATGDSTCAGARRALFDRGVWPPNPWAELRHACAAWNRIAKLEDVDIVHVSSASALPFTNLFPIPTVATIHHDRDESLLAHYAAYPHVDFVAISRRQAELSPEVPFRAIVHHGLDIERYPLGSGGERCAFLGRFAVQKAPHLAIEAASRAGLPIVLAGEAHPADRDYFDREVAPRLGANARWAGEADHAAKVELLQSSRCLVFPIQWEEPFGLVMIEAMLVGTPVIAFARGSAPEVVDDGVTGFLVRSLDELAQRLRDAATLDRRACRERARARWSATRMSQAYVAVYRDAIDRWSDPRPGHTLATRGDNGAAFPRLRR
ncbi:MAG: glycosyltransferase family 4 protein [Labilithrix sp.]|nr:glycosyltransferase family 4 protein [Labilithrix sp.]